jgi:hypothetical protein
MALPLWMLKKMQMSLFHKLGLAAIFLLATIDIVFDILRTYHTIGGTTSLSVLWDILEPTIAVVVSTMPTYRALYTSVKREYSKSYPAHYNSAPIETGHRSQQDQEAGLKSANGI